MRKAFKGGFVAGTDGKEIGIYLGADFCAEHEWGIKGIKNTFGIGVNKEPGLPRRMITKLPKSEGDVYDEELRLFTVGDNTYLVFAYKNTIDWIQNPKSQERRYSELTIRKDEQLATAWDEKNFGVIVDKTHKALLEEIYAAFQKKDIALCAGGGGIFDNPGISIVIASKIDEESKKIWKEGDEDYQRLLKADEETTIKKYLKEKKKEYFALSPRWAKDIKSETCKTQYPVVYWLNPMEQDKNNCGWYTVEDLKLWGEDKGPVIK